MTPSADPHAYFWLATLTHGSIYTLALGRRENGAPADWITFEQDVPVPVTDNQKAHLEEHAVLRLRNPGFDEEFAYEGEDPLMLRQMFRFTPNVPASEVVASTVAPRRRTAAQA